MATQTVTAMFETRAEAERAAEALRSQMSILPGAIHVVDQGSDAGVVDTANTNRDEDKGFFGSIKSLFLPDEDSHSYTEGVRRGDVLVSATVEHDQAGRAMDILEQHGALDYDSREQSWRAGGWQGYDQTATTTAAAVPASAAIGGAAVGTAAMATPRPVAAATTAATTATGNNDAISLYEERLVVGKRDVSHGRVRVRTYVTETPVSELIRLRQEHVTLERRPVDRAVAPGEDVFRERTIEATETSEEAVVGKDVRVREEIALRKDVTTDEKTIKDSVRRTEVDIENDLGASSVKGATSVTGSAGYATGSSSVGSGSRGTSAGGTSTVAGSLGTSSTRAI